MDIFNKYKKFGFPWLCGYQEMPAYLITIYEIFDMTIEEWHAYKAKKARNK